MICRNCGAGMEADRIDASLRIITCSHCGSLHDIPGDHPADTADSGADSTRARPERLEVAMPSRFKVQQGASGMQVSWPVGGIFQGLVLTVIAAGFVYAAMTSGMWILLIASVGLFYFAAVKAFNKHHIRVDAARLEVSQGPLPWPGTRKLDASDILQLFATEHESRIESGNGSSRRVQVRKHYRLSANTHNGGEIALLGGLGDPRQALWLEQEIERLLGIVNTQVAGEHEL